MPDAAEERGFLTKPVSAAGTVAIPPRAGEALRRFTDFTYPPKPKARSATRSSAARGAVTKTGRVEAF
jgi:hypothetical protein